MITVRHLQKAFHGQTVLRDVSFEIAAGEIVVLLGESGSGKSVLLRHLIGLERPDSGEVVIHGQDITRLDERGLLSVRREIGFLFQEGALYDFMTVEENVAFPLVEQGETSDQEVNDRVEKILTLVGLEGAAEKLPMELSGGMKKRAALARAVVLGTTIVLCDEPTSGLDPIRSREIADLIRKIARDLKCTIVIASHDMANAFRIADRLLVIKDGTIRLAGTPAEIRASQDPFMKEFLSSA